MLQLGGHYNVFLYMGLGVSAAVERFLLHTKKIPLAEQEGQAPS